MTAISVPGRHGVVTGQRLPCTGEFAGDLPLIVALHGGGCTARYFDRPGFSFLERAAALGIPALALDRPGHGGSAPLPAFEATITGNADFCDELIGDLWGSEHGNCRGIVLVGHSIGGAIAIEIAAKQPAWPLLGLAVSGVGLVSPSEIEEAWEALPNTPSVELPAEIRSSLFFGPDGTFDAVALEASLAASAPALRSELIDIVTAWPACVRVIAGKVTVPLHYRLAEFEQLWITDQDQVDAFAQAFSSSPQVDARLYPASGHVIDFHRVGAAFQLEQLAFAARCAALCN